MDEIMKLKQKFSYPDSEQICKIITQHASARDSYIEENELRLVEDQRKIEDLSRQLSIVQEKLDADKKLFGEKTQELKRENEKLEELRTERNRISKSNLNLERKCHKLRTVKPNAKDQLILENGLKKYNLYKQLTGIRWNFSELEEATKGFVTDKKNYLHTFSYPKEIQGEELSDLLWKEIELSTKKQPHDDADKENSASNT